MVRHLLLVLALAYLYSVAHSSRDQYEVKFRQFDVGMVVYFVYDVPEKGDSKLNFAHKDDVLMNIAHHHRGNFLEFDVFKNHHEENTVAPGNFHFKKKDKRIYLIMEAKEKGFEVYANGNHFFFNHTSDLNEIDSVSAWSAETVQLRVGKVLPDFAVGRVVYIKGMAPEKGGFVVDFLPTATSKLSWERIFLHFSVRFYGNPNTVTRNTFSRIDRLNSEPSCSGWEAEDKTGGMPFTPGKPFEMIIIAQQYGLEIAVDGSHFTTYTYRAPLSRNMTVMLNDVPEIYSIDYY